jgi:hypothetical protein
MTTRATSPVRRRSLAAGLSAGALLVLAACGGTDDGATTPPAAGPLIKVAAGVGPMGGRVANGAAAEMSADMAIWAPTEYVLVGELPALDTPVSGWSYPAAGELDAAGVAKVLGVLGMSGEPVAVSADQGGGWRVGPDDGSAPSVWFSRDGLASWWFQPAWDTTERAPVECYPVSAPDEASPPDTIEDLIVCDKPTPPVGIPTEDQARARSLELLAALGAEPAAYDVEVYADEWGAWTTAWAKLDGKRTGLAWSFGFGEEGALTYASGFLGTAQPVGPFDRVGTTEGFRRLQEGGQAWWWGGVGGDTAYDTVGGVARAEPASNANDEAPTVAIDPVPGEEAVIVNTEPLPIDEIAVEEVPEMEPVVVEIVDVREEWWMIYDVDGAAWLVPAYAFLDRDGGSYLVPAIPDEVVEVSEPVETTVPVDVTEPVETTGPTETIVPEPTVPTQPTGPVEVTEPGETTPEPGLSEQDLQGLIGMTEAEAVEKLAGIGFELRVIEIDGEPLAATTDYREDRVNVALADGLIVSASIG